MKLSTNDKRVTSKVLRAVCESMEFDNITQRYIDGGRITLTLAEHELLTIKWILTHLEKVNVS
jgi:hypothetical protein